MLKPTEEPQMININESLKTYYQNRFLNYREQDLEQMLLMKIQGDAYFHRSISFLTPKGEVLIEGIPAHRDLETIAKSFSFPTPQEVRIGYYQAKRRVSEEVFPLDKKRYL